MVKVKWLANSPRLEQQQMLSATGHIVTHYGLLHGYQEASCRAARVFFLACRVKLCAVRRTNYIQNFHIFPGRAEAQGEVWGDAHDPSPQVSGRGAKGAERQIPRKNSFWRDCNGLLVSRLRSQLMSL